jgi:hypothetical protein
MLNLLTFESQEWLQANCAGPEISPSFGPDERLDANVARLLSSFQFYQIRQYLALEAFPRNAYSGTLIN